MAKVVKTVGKIVGGIASVLAIIPGPHQPIAAAVAVVANVASGVAAQALAKNNPTPARGSVTQIRIEAEPPSPYLMGEAYFAGHLRHDRGYGGKIKDVPNPYRGMVIAYSVGGPVEELVQAQANFAAIGSYYNGFLYTDTQLGRAPEPAALTPQFAGLPGWSSAHKLSGTPAILWNLKFDKDGKVFSSGVPAIGGLWKGVKVYDPRKDDTFPGGSGAHRLGDESTYEYSEWPALHAGTYAYGRYANGKKVMGVGLPAEGINWQSVAAWANVCEANDWRISGVVEEPGNRWTNLKDICFAGGGAPIFARGVLSFMFSAPQASLYTVTRKDIGEGRPQVHGMQSWRDRINTVVPKYRSPDHNWELVSAEEVQVPTYLAEDGERKALEFPYNLVRDKDQAAQLAAYRIVDGRELMPITLPMLPHMRNYRPGECLYLDLPDYGLDTKAIILGRSFDPRTMQVNLTFMGETEVKHAYALGQTGVPPATPFPGQTQEDRDEVAANAGDPRGARTLKTLSVNYPLSSDDDSISIVAFTGTTDTGEEIAFPAGTITGLASGGDYIVMWDTDDGSYAAFPHPATAPMADSGYVVIGRQMTSTGGTYDDPEPPPPGNCVADDTPVLLADGTEVLAGDLVVGTVLKTRHEHSLAWGEWPVIAINFEDDNVFACQLDGANGPVTIRATARHRFLIDNRWVCACEIGTPDGTARVAKITVAGAHTYISNGVLSHNIKAGGPGGL